MRFDVLVLRRRAGDVEEDRTRRIGTRRARPVALEAVETQTTPASRRTIAA
jgi:hypothetical protein